MALNIADIADIENDVVDNVNEARSKFEDLLNDIVDNIFPILN